MWTFLRAQVIHGSLGEIRTLAEWGIGLFTVRQPFYLPLTSDAPDLLKVTLDLPLDSVVLSSWISSASTLSGLVNRPTAYVWGGWQMLGPYL